MKYMKHLKRQIYLVMHLFLIIQLHKGLSYWKTLNYKGKNSIKFPISDFKFNSEVFDNSFNLGIEDLSHQERKAVSQIISGNTIFQIGDLQGTLDSIYEMEGNLPGFYKRFLRQDKWSTQDQERMKFLISMIL